LRLRRFAITTVNIYKAARSQDEGGKWGYFSCVAPTVDVVLYAALRLQGQLHTSAQATDQAKPPPQSHPDT
jgi:hypothetical protein